MQQLNYKAAIKHYKKVISQDADYISEVIQPLIQCHKMIQAEKLDSFPDLINQIPEAKPRVRMIPLWGETKILVVLLILMTTFWVLRKANGYF